MKSSTFRSRRTSRTSSFRLEQEPYWVTESITSTAMPDSSWVIDHLLPAAFRWARLRARAARRTEELILRNAENLRWAILRGLDETFRRATSRFEERLDDATRATRGVIEDALARRRDKSFSVEPELGRLEQAIAVLAAARDELADESGSVVRCRPGLVLLLQRSECCLADVRFRLRLEPLVATLNSIEGDGVPPKPPQG